MQICYVNNYIPSLYFFYPGLTELASCSNVYLKVSGLFMTDSNWDQQSFARVVNLCTESFGIER